MKDLCVEEFEAMLCSTGYLPPRNEDELDFFNQLYEGYMSRIEDRHVDIDTIVNGKCRVISMSSISYEEQTNLCSKVSDDADGRYSMAARNYMNLPNNILEKMKKQHKPQDDDED
jgi:hypothetical protein